MEKEIIKKLKKNGYYIGLLKGDECTNIKSFLINIAKAFKFPDYYGENINAFFECISDLDWIPESNYALIITHSGLFMSNDTNDNKNYMLNLLNKVSIEWSHVPNFEGEGEFRSKADFKVIFC